MRFLLAGKNKKFHGVYDLFQRIEEGREKVECKTLIFFQVIFVLKSFYKVEKDPIVEMMLDLLDFRGFHVERKSYSKNAPTLAKNQQRDH